MKEINKDFWHITVEKGDALCCTTNGVVKDNGELVMGGGIAKDFARLFPFLPSEWGSRLQKYYDIYGFGEGFNDPPILVSKDDRGIDLVSFPTKTDWRSKSEINLIKRSAEKLVIVANALNWNNIYLTRPGCGLGGLSWNNVKPILEKYFDDRFVIVNKEK